MSEKHTYPAQASLSRALKRGTGAAWECLGYVVGVSFAAFLLCAIVLTTTGLIAPHITTGLPSLFLVLPCVLAAWLCAVGVFSYAKKMLYHEQPTPLDTWKGIRKLAGPAIALFTLDLLVSVVLFGDIIFFVLAFKAKGGVTFAALGIISAYITLMWLLMSLYHLPLLVAQLDTESGPRVWMIIKKSFLLAADNPGFTLGLFVVIIAFGALCVITVLGIALLFLGVTAFLLTSSLRDLYIKYGIITEEPEVVEDKPWRLQ